MKRVYLLLCLLLFVELASAQAISSFPYFQNFETGPNSWTASGKNSTWAFGTPSKATINSAGSGSFCWVNGNLSGNYLANDSSFVYSPYFDLSGQTDLWFALKRNFLSEANFDGAALQATTDSGATWATIGNFGDPHNWYNNNPLIGQIVQNIGTVGWGGSSNGWKQAKAPLGALNGEPDVKFRIAFASDNGVNVGEGFAFDDVAVASPPPLFLGNDTTVCDSFTLSSGYATGTFQWSTSEITPSITIYNGTAFTQVETIILTYTDAMGLCSMDTIVVTLSPSPTAVFTGLSPEYCLSDAPATLFAVPAGGVFSGPGIVGPTSWDPTTAGVGPKVVTYSYVDVISGCTAVSTQNVTVKALPVLNVAGLAPTYCVNDAANLLTGTPTGATGSFSGPGVTFSSPNYLFDPATAGTGSHTITYQYTDPSTTCTNSLDQNTLVNALPTLTLAGLASSYCLSDAPDILTGTPAGGTFTGGGVFFNGTNFVYDPATAGVGNDLVSYSFTNANGCTNTISTPTVVSTPPTATIIGLGTQYCVNGASVTLTGVPAGGTFSGPAMLFNVFVPPLGGPGPSTVSYSFTDPVSGCSNIQNTVVMIHDTTPVSFAGLAASYCDYSPQALLFGSPAGGSYNGPGVLGNAFNPITAGPGTHTISYVAVDGNGCTNSTSRTTTVNTATASTFSGLNSSYCQNNPAALLTGSPASGTFSGPGVVGNSFFPSTAGQGVHTISYLYTDPLTGCTDTSSQTTLVSPLPLVSFSGLLTQYCEKSGGVTLSGSPAGGTFSGPGMFGNLFIPDSAGVGSHALSYTYTNAGGCSNTASQIVEVFALPNSSFSGLAPEFCIHDAPALLSGTPSGGIFSGPGMFGSLFVPDSAGVGTHTVSYAYTSLNGCTKTSTQLVTIHAAPVLDINGLGSDYCEDASPALLVGVPSGGTFSGDGLFGSTFFPTVAGVGPHTITYSYTDINGCSNTLDQSVLVNPLPTPTITGLAAAYCLDVDSVVLTGSPAGGSFSGPGVSSGKFYPGLAGVGTHSLTYTYTDVKGCMNSTTKSVVVHPLPSPSFIGLATQYCVDAPALSLSGSPVGGVFAGAGILGNVFAPATAGIGNHIVSYSVTNANGCSNTHIQNVVVHPVPNPTFTGLLLDYCIDDPSVALTGNPTGGTFSGAGVSTGMFNPVLAGIGEHNINYLYTDANGCSNSSTISTTIHALPTPSFTGLGPKYCQNSASVTLTGLPAGGVFSGPGINGNDFVPVSTGPGTFVITYTYQDAFGCEASTSKNVIVTPLPSPTFGGLPTSICEDDGVIPLLPNPTGGTFSGPGMTGNLFNPTVAGVGLHTVTYAYTDANGCSNTFSTNIPVNSRPVVSFTGLGTVYCENSDGPVLIGSPSGGTFSGPGISGNQFVPSMAGVGVHTITYTYTEVNGCENSHSESVVVNTNPLLVFAGLDSSVCVDHAPLNLTGSPALGTFSGMGMSGSTFYPAIAGSGLHTVTYTYTNANGCTSSVSEDIQVNLLPNVSYFGLDPEYCLNDTAAQLFGTPVGGTFSGPGINGDYFSPGLAGVGSAVINYHFVDGNGCQSAYNEGTVVRNLPTITFSGLSELYCEDAGSVILTGVPTGGSFSGTGIQGTEFFPAQTELGASNVSYHYTDANGCTNVTTQTTNILALPQLSLTVLDHQMCEGESPQEIFAEPEGGVFLGVGVVGTEFFPSTTGIGTHSFHYDYTDGNGCSNTISDQITVVADPVVDLGSAQVICDEVPTVLSAGNAGSTFQWSTFANSQSISVTQAGTYSVTVTDQNGCVGEDSKTLEVDAMSDISFDTTFCPTVQFNVTNTSNLATEYFWDFNDGNNTSTLQYPTYTFSGNGVYNVTLTASNECGTRTRSEFVHINCLVYVDPVLNFEITVYPNPGQGEFKLDISNSPESTVKVEVFDVKGSKIWSNRLNTQGGNVNELIDITEFNDGVYLFQVHVGDQIISKKIVKQ